MVNLLKNNYNKESITQFAGEIKKVHPVFEIESFVNDVLNDTWDELELKQRMHHIAEVLHQHLAVDYARAIGIFDQIIANFNAFFVMVCIDYVEQYGLDEENYSLSINALENYTRYSSSEFAIRAFIIKYEEKTMEKMMEWTKHENEHVRRLSSEGCRPQLPWAQALESFKKDPTKVVAILEELKDDSSAYVRKSVANNLNDISKSNPQVVIKIAQEWLGENDNRDRIVKHGCRTLLKKGNSDVLALFGHEDSSTIETSDFTIKNKKVPFGGDLIFSFTIKSAKATKVRLEYGIDFMKANGKTSRKIFKISETSLNINESKTYERKQSFKEITTRKYYPGHHSVALIINGEEKGKLDFELLDK